MPHDSVEATGAKPGDTVKCVGRRDPPGVMEDKPAFELEATYPVTLHAGRPAVRGMFFGFGWYWEKVEA